MLIKGKKDKNISYSYWVWFNVCASLEIVWPPLVAQMIENLPVMQETWVQFLGWEDPLEEEMATHSNILAWRIPWKKLLNIVN